ncbi:MAG: SRPBCC family protein [Proteobacteria bacterium]|nr:SRPBCC family protein [Pseudomonadota bacterium]MDA0995014.1 SRPBCC family protein [Pseudomonadota bacterium]
MELKNVPVAKTELLIRKPVAQVFEAFIDPEMITKFWFDRSSGRLESGQTVQWHWDLFDMAIDVRVKAIEANQRILIEWGTDAANVTTVEWTFTARTDETTYVSILVGGFSGDADKIVSQALDSMGGFSLVLAAAKAWLEHGIQLNIVADRF